MRLGLPLATLLALSCAWSPTPHAARVTPPLYSVPARHGVVFLSSPTSEVASLFPAWPEGSLSGKRELHAMIRAFIATTTSVPLAASSEPGDAYAEWLEGGFVAHKFITSKLSRKTYVTVLVLLLELVVASQARYPDLYAVLKFVPKKNGLNPLLSRLNGWEGGAEGEGAHELEASLGIEALRPREARRRLDDLSRALEQCWLLLSSYLTLPDPASRTDFLWSARTLVEKVKTDQRSRALEILCLGAYSRSSPLYPHVLAPANQPKAARRAREQQFMSRCFETSFGSDWHPKPTNARLIWQRCRMSYPFLETAHRAWLGSESSPGAPLGEGTDEEEAENRAAMGRLLDRIARASPEEKVINSLVYWLLDMAYKASCSDEKIAAWEVEPFLLRRAGVLPKMVEELERIGHLLQLLSRSTRRPLPSEAAGAAAGAGAKAEGGASTSGSSGPSGSSGEALLLRVKSVESTTTLLSSIRASCADSCPEVLYQYEELMRSPHLSLPRLEQLEFRALGALLGLDGSFVEERADAVRSALSEWRNPELLFRYLDDNRHDERMAPLITRWLRAIFGLSGESLRMIRRETPENVRHLLTVPQDVLLRWYSEYCPGTSKCKTLFMLGEDSGSCLRIISNEGNRYNRALMGYVLQSHVRALVVTDGVGRVLVRSLIRLVLRSDNLSPVIFCDPMFFTSGYSAELQAQLLAQAAALEAHMRIPVVHAGSVLPVVDDGELAEGLCYIDCPTRPKTITQKGYVREVKTLDYEMVWVELLEMDGVAPYTYSEELPYDELLDQHEAGVLERSEEKPALVIAVLPRADSPSADRYVRERDGETAWTMHRKEGGKRPKQASDVPAQVAAQISDREHISHSFDPNARAWDEDNNAPTPNYRGPRLDE